MMHTILPKKLLVSVQLLALVLLQLPMFLPLVENAFSLHSRGAVCHQDHRLCGCSPDRIASKTCCCSRVAESSRLAADPGEKNDADSCCHYGQASKGQHTLKMAPCGAASPQFIAAVQDYLPPQYMGELVSPVGIVSPFFEYPGSLRVRYSDPAVPPPELTLTV